MNDGRRADPDLSYSVLGPFTVTRAGRPLTLGGLKRATTLAALLHEANRVVPVGSLIEAVWGADHPDTAENALQVHVSALRRALAPAQGSRTGAPISWLRSGYRLMVDETGYDVARLRAVRTQAQKRLASGEADVAADLLRQAEALWRGPSLADLRGTLFIDEWALSLDELRLVVLEERIDADLMGGRYLEIIPELTSLTREYPLRESLWGLLMTALYWTGRQAEALEAFSSLHRLLAEELGIEPNRGLRDLQVSILEQSVSRPTSRVSRQIPPDEPTERDTHGTAPRARLVRSDGRSHDLTRVPFTIGRSRDCDLHVDSTLASRRHAQVIWHSDRFALVDLGSTNGTQLNGLGVTQAYLDDGDVLTVGGVDLRFHRDG